MKRYDIESFLKDVESILKAEINNKINEINTEKGDFNLDLVDDKAYIYQSMNEEITNFNPTIFYYLDDIRSEGIDSATSEEVVVEVVVILTDTQDGNTQHKLLRYLRVLKELFNTHFNKVHYSKKVIVESLVPIPFALQNSSNYLHAIGVRLTTAIV